MKITKRQLKRIIREEYSKLQNQKNIRNRYRRIIEENTADTIEEEANIRMNAWVAENPGASREDTMTEYGRLMDELKGGY